MISTRNLLILVVVAVVMVAVTVALYSGPKRGPGGFEAGAPLMQGLAPEKVQTIALTQGATTVTLKRKDKGFVIAERDGYPAAPGKVNELLLACMDVRCRSKVTDAKSNHSDLGVVEGGADALSIVFKDAADKTLTGMVRGKTGESGGPYVRLIDKDTVYVAENNIYVTVAPAWFTDKKLIDVKSEDIRRVDVEAGGGKYVITRDEKGAVALTPIPAGKRVKESVRDTVLNALGGFEFTDVSSAATTPLDWDATYTCQLASELVYTVKLAKKDNKHYAKVSAASSNTGSVKITRSEGDEELKKKEALLQGVEKARDFTPRHAPWVYEVPSWTAEKLRHPLADLVEDIPKETPPAQTDAAPTTPPSPAAPAPAAAPAPKTPPAPVTIVPAPAKK